MLADMLRVAWASSLLQGSMREHDWCGWMGAHCVAWCGTGDHGMAGCIYFECRFDGRRATGDGRRAVTD